MGSSLEVGRFAVEVAVGVGALFAIAVRCVPCVPHERIIRLETCCGRNWSLTRRKVPSQITMRLATPDLDPRTAIEDLHVVWHFRAELPRAQRTS